MNSRQTVSRWPDCRSPPNGRRRIRTGPKAYLRGASEQGLTADVLSALGSANLRLGRLGQAETLLRQATKKEETFAAAWNNLGVVLMERGKFGEAARVFRTAFALDSGESADIRDNLRLALEKLENPGYLGEDNHNFRTGAPGGWGFSASFDTIKTSESRAVNKRTQANAPIYFFDTVPGGHGYTFSM